MAVKLHSLPPQVEDLKRHGVTSVIPLFDGKKPGYAGWQKLGEDEIKNKFWSWGGDSPLNFGIRLGREYGSLVDLDLDSEESRRLWRYFFPSGVAFGRGGNITHVLFKQVGRDPMDSRRYQWDKRDEKSVLLEVRFNGQTMGPGSVHPVSGETIEWMHDQGVVLGEIDAADLRKRAGMLAAASLLLRDWDQGWRDEVCTCLCGAMLRGGWNADECDQFFGAIATVSGDEESEMRQKGERLAGLLVDGGRVPGIRRMMELMPGGESGSAGRLIEWLELRGGGLLEEMNDRHALVMIGGSAYILDEQTGAMLKKEAFSLLWANRRVQVRGRDVGASDFWLQSEGRRSYGGGVGFFPEWCGIEEGSGEWKSRGYGDVWNLWRGFGVQEREGCGQLVNIGGVEIEREWALWARHVYEELCWSDDGIWRWVIEWFAHRVSRPWEVPGSALVMVGERGDGKGTIASLFGELFGEGFMTVTHQNQLVGKFNSHMENKVLVFADEATWGGDKVGEGMLKTMITDERRVIERKGQEAYSVDNCCGYMIASNHDWVVPVGRMERRFFIARMKGLRAGDVEYFDRIRRQWREEGGSGVALGGLRRIWRERAGSEGGFRAGGPAAGMGLSKVKWTGGDGGGDFGFEQWIRGSGSVEQWLVELLIEKDGRAGVSASGGSGSGGSGSGAVWWWRDEAVVLGGAHDAYIRWCKDRGIGRVEHSVPFGKTLCKLLPVVGGQTGRIWVRTADGRREMGRKVDMGKLDGNGLLGYLKCTVGF